MKLKEHLKSGVGWLPLAEGGIDEPQYAGSAAPAQFVNEFVIEKVLDVPVKTLRNWRVSGRGPPFSKFGASVRYELATAIAWARARQVSSTSDAGVGT